MSINMTQAFAFETDSLESLKSALTTIVQVLFKNPDSRYHKPYIQLKEPDFWRDGMDHGWEFEYRPSILDTTTLGATPDPEPRYALVDVCGMFGGADQIKAVEGTQRYDDQDEAAAAAIAIGKEKGKKPRPTRFFIACLGDSAYQVSQRKEGNLILCSSLEQMVHKTIIQLKSVTESRSALDQFWQKCGDGYNSGFSSFDGSIGAGYRLHWEPNGGADLLYVSLVHMYYGK